MMATLTSEGTVKVHHVLCEFEALNMTEMDMSDGSH